MKRIFAAILVFFGTGCATPQKRNQAFLENRSLRFLSKEDLKKELWDRVGIRLEEAIFQVPRVVSYSALTETQFVQQIPFQLLGRGDRMDKQSQLTSIKTGDWFLGINSVLLATSSQKMAGELGGQAVFLTHDTAELKVILINDQYLSVQNQIFFSKSLFTLKLLVVAEVRSGSWVAKYHIEKGDILIGKGLLREAQNRRQWILGKIKSQKRVDLENKESNLMNADEASRFFLEVFRDLGEFRNQNGDVMELESYLKIRVVRENNIRLWELYRNRHFGLGIDFSCGNSCGRVPPIIAKIFSDSEVEKAGLQVGDEIKEVNSQPIATAADVTKLANAISPGSEVEFKAVRGLESFKVKVIIGWVVVEH